MFDLFLTVAPYLLTVFGVVLGFVFFFIHLSVVESDNKARATKRAEQASERAAQRVLTEEQYSKGMAEIAARYEK